MAERARLEPRAAGLTPITDGWFVVNIADAPWWTNRGHRLRPRGDEVETTSEDEAYGRFPRWRPGRPPSWAGLPWA
jgi:hypothetical protein